MDHPMWWDEEMVMMAAHRTKCTLLQEVIRYTVKPYFEIPPIFVG
jgi:hypothetical protein